MLKVLCQDPGERLASLREVGTAVVAFLVEYVAVFVVSKNLLTTNFVTTAFVSAGRNHPSKHSSR